jgi:hypothetical protein
MLESVGDDIFVVSNATSACVVMLESKSDDIFAVAVVNLVA